MTKKLFFPGNSGMNVVLRPVHVELADVRYPLVLELTDKFLDWIQSQPVSVIGEDLGLGNMAIWTIKLRDVL